jgi:DNA-binding winged helix-turn-helix (wHTH) protein
VKWPAETNTVEVHIFNLRRKIGRGFIRTVRGAGYQIVANPERDAEDWCPSRRTVRQR